MTEILTRRIAVLFFPLLAFVGCARNVEFSHEFLFSADPVDRTSAANEAGSVRSLTVTADQLRDGLDEAGFTPEDIQALVVDRAVLEPAYSNGTLDWIEGFSLFATNAVSGGRVVHGSGPLSGTQALLDLSGNDLMPFYTDPPFVFSAFFTGKAGDDPVRLLVSGRASFRNR
jgi:hypothetical protein